MACTTSNINTLTRKNIDLDKNKTQFCEKSIFHDKIAGIQFTELKWFSKKISFAIQHISELLKINLM